MDVMTWAKKKQFLPQTRFFYPMFIVLYHLTIKQMK